MRVTCSKGTYIRTLGEDVGEAWAAAPICVFCAVWKPAVLRCRCVTLEALEAMNDEERIAQVQPVDTLLHRHAVVTLGEQDAGRFLSGLRRRGSWADAPAVAVYGERPHALLG
jgi:tRNA pseudouridine55 synthase